MENKQCPNCGAEMRLREKDGSKFWACPNYRARGCKTQRYEEIPGTNFQKIEKPQNGKPQDGWTIITDEIAAINRRLDNASDMFVKLREDVNKLMGK